MKKLEAHFEDGAEILCRDGKLNKSLYAIYNSPTFVFVEDDIFNSLSDEDKSGSSSVGTGADELSVDEMLAEKILYVIMPRYNLSDIKDVVSVVESYSKKHLNYVVLRNI